ncbi:hypothetical protein Tco_1531563 [Tanacetum coccineum]
MDNTDVHQFNHKRHDYPWTRDHPLEQVRGNPTMPVSNKTTRCATGSPGKERKRFTLHNRKVVDPDHPEKVYLTEEAMYGLKARSKSLHDQLKPPQEDKRIIKYPKGVPLTWDSGNQRILALILTAFRPNHCGCLDTRNKPSGGRYSIFCEKHVSWISKKQNCTACPLGRGRVRGVICNWLKYVDRGHSCLDKAQLQQNTVYCDSQNHKLIADIENDIMDPVMQCTTLPSHSSFSQQKLVSFVTEIHTLSIDISSPYQLTIE